MPTMDDFVEVSSLANSLDSRADSKYTGVASQYTGGIGKW